jgi:hypothetical protein
MKFDRAHFRYQFLLAVQHRPQVGEENIAVFHYHRVNWHPTDASPIVCGGQRPILQRDIVGNGVEHGKAN